MALMSAARPLTSFSLLSGGVGKVVLSVVGSLNPAQDFIVIGVKPVPIFVPRWTTAAIVRVVGNKGPTPTLRLNGALSRAGHTPQQRRTRWQIRAVKWLP